MKRITLFLSFLKHLIPLNIKGVFPKKAIVSDHKDRTEAGIGVLIPWAKVNKSAEVTVQFIYN